jgi:hypothetical protein
MFYTPYAFGRINQSLHQAFLPQVQVPALGQQSLNFVGAPQKTCPENN